jgi:transcriptional regulator with XRE-family HTH domain
MLRRNRIRRDLTQADLAREARMSVDTAKRAESGRPIRTDNLVRILRVLGLSPPITGGWLSARRGRPVWAAPIGEAGLGERTG